mmetsp:Transcript_59322/g.170385  ORF Transcript_59322/g.170385 Transcript_59322/m.170385 type:complete len:394 (-) Transcript_59322:71-1252(-)
MPADGQDRASAYGHAWGQADVGISFAGAQSGGYPPHSSGHPPQRWGASSNAQGYHIAAGLFDDELPGELPNKFVEGGSSESTRPGTASASAGNSADSARRPAASAPSVDYSVRSSASSSWAPPASALDGHDVAPSHTASRLNVGPMYVRPAGIAVPPWGASAGALQASGHDAQSIGARHPWHGQEGRGLGIAGVRRDEGDNFSTADRLSRSYESGNSALSASEHDGNESRQDSADEGVDPSSPGLPSIGSKGHPMECKPCQFVHTPVKCAKGAFCGFCHHKHSWHGRPRPNRDKRKRFRKALEGQLAALQTEGDEAADEAEPPMPTFADTRDSAQGGHPAPVSLPQEAREAAAAYGFLAASAEVFEAASQFWPASRTEGSVHQISSMVIRLSL